MKFEFDDKGSGEVLAFINHSGGLVLRNRDNCLNTVVTHLGEAHQGYLEFEKYLSPHYKSFRKGDKLTITF